jgi:hypothetical protein
MSADMSTLIPQNLCTSTSANIVAHTYMSIIQTYLKLKGLLITRTLHRLHKNTYFVTKKIIRITKALKFSSYVNSFFFILP